MTCCQLSQAGLDGLAAALPGLAHMELRLHDGMAGEGLWWLPGLQDADGPNIGSEVDGCFRGRVAAATKPAVGVARRSGQSLPVGSAEAGCGSDRRFVTPRCMPSPTTFQLVHFCALQSSSLRASAVPFCLHGFQLPVLPAAPASVLCTALRRQALKCTVEHWHTPPAVDCLLRRSCIGAGGTLMAHVTRTKAASLLAAASQQMPGEAGLAVSHMGGSFLLTSPPDFRLMTSLTSLRCRGGQRVGLRPGMPGVGALLSSRRHVAVGFCATLGLDSCLLLSGQFRRVSIAPHSRRWPRPCSLPRIQLPLEAVRQLAACTDLRLLDVELHFSVRDEALAGWAALTHLRCLRLCGSFYLSDGALAAVLAAMPRLQVGTGAVGRRMQVLQWQVLAHQHGVRVGGG